MTNIHDEIISRFGVSLSTRAWNLIKYEFADEYPTLDDLIQALKEKPHEMEIRMLRVPNTGRKTVNEIRQVLEVAPSPRNVSTAIVQAVYDNRVLTKEDVRFIRKLMSAQLSISDEGPIADQIRDLRERLPL